MLCVSCELGVFCLLCKLFVLCELFVLCVFCVVCVLCVLCTSCVLRTALLAGEPSRDMTGVKLGEGTADSVGVTEGNRVEMRDAVGDQVGPDEWGERGARDGAGCVG